MWPGLWPGLAWPQAITASGRFRGLGFLTRGLRPGRPQAADSGRLRPWARPWPAAARRHCLYLDLFLIFKVQIARRRSPRWFTHGAEISARRIAIWSGTFPQFFFFSKFIFLRGDRPRASFVAKCIRCTSIRHIGCNT